MWGMGRRVRGVLRHKSTRGAFFSTRVVHHVSAPWPGDDGLGCALVLPPDVRLSLLAWQRLRDGPVKLVPAQRRAASGDRAIPQWHLVHRRRCDRPRNCRARSFLCE